MHFSKLAEINVFFQKEGRCLCEIYSRFLTVCSEAADALKSKRYNHNIIFSTALNNNRDVSAMFRKISFLKTGKCLFLSILFSGICQHPDFLKFFDGCRV